MKNNILFFLLSLILFSCGENKKETTKSEEVQRLVKSEPDMQAAEIALDSNVFYIEDIYGKKIPVRDTVWKRYYPPVDTTPVENKPPIVNAGNDQSITLPTSTVTLSGFANDPEGDAITYKWVKLSGSGGTITSSTSATTTVTGLTAGSYQFRLGAIDEDGATGTDDLNITVNPAPVQTAIIEGYGSQATGGAGQQTIRITNLSQLKSNIGSNRTLLIDVSGTTSSFSISGVSNLTIDCYSTKQDVTITGGGSDGITVDNSTNVIVSGFRTKGYSNDGINVTGSSQKVVINHHSSYDNGDGNIDLVATASAGKNFTVQWSIMGKNRGTGNMLITTQNASVHHNLFIGDGSGEGAERNPFAHSNYSPKGTTSSPNFDVRNNLIHASGAYASGCGYGAVGNFVNNYYTSNKSGLINLCADPASCSKAHVSGNYNQASPSGGSSSPEYTIPSQYKINMTDATTAGKAVLASVGPYKRDSYEQGVINSINIGGGGSTACTGYTYSAYGPCDPTTGTQSRTVTGTTPAGCTGTPSVSPVLTQTCGGGGDTYPGYTLVYQNGYNTWNAQTQTGDLDPFKTGQLGNGSLSTTIFHEAPGSFKSVPANVSSGIRSEVQYGNNQTPLDGIVSYWAYYETIFQNDGHSWQWHPSTDGGSGSGLYHEGGKFVFVSVEQGTTGTRYNTGYTIPKNKWIKIVMTYRFGSSGYIKLQIDGVTLLDKNIKLGDGSRPYAKHGVNMWKNQSSVVYYDEFKTFKKD